MDCTTGVVQTRAPPTIGAALEHRAAVHASRCVSSIVLSSFTCSSVFGVCANARGRTPLRLYAVAVFRPYASPESDYASARDAYTV